jgi:hypothetical protein
LEGQKRKKPSADLADSGRQGGIASKKIIGFVAKLVRRPFPIGCPGRHRTKILLKRNDHWRTLSRTILALDGGGHMTSMTATDARKRLYALLDAVADSHEPIQIAGKRHSAVLV